MFPHVEADPSSLKRALCALRRKHKVPGVQLAVHHGGGTISFEVGEVDHGTGDVMNPDTGVPIGSVTKCFTATVAMVLVSDGDLDLDTPVGEYLTEPVDVEKATLRQLLSHTGGLVSDPDTGAPAESIRRYVSEHCQRANLISEPGTAFSYSNLGYVLAGRLIETITGMDWWEAIESILLRPLSIGTAYVCAPRPRPRRAVAVGHSVNPATGRVRPVRQSLPLALAPAGALAVSATDLVRLGLMHLGTGHPELLAPEYAREMREPVPHIDAVGLADGWGLGLAVFDHGGVRWVGHDGNADGTSCHLRVDPVGGTVVAFTSNANTGHGLWRELCAELARAGIPIGASEASPLPPASPPSGCVGRYVNGNVEFVVTAGSDALFLSVDGDAPSRLTCYEGLAFVVRDPSNPDLLGGRFLRDAHSGLIRRIQLGGRLACRVDEPADANAVDRRQFVSSRRGGH